MYSLEDIRAISRGASETDFIEIKLLSHNSVIAKRPALQFQSTVTN